MSESPAKKQRVEEHQQSPASPVERDQESEEAEGHPRIMPYLQEFCHGKGVTAFIVVDGKETKLFCKANRLMCQEEVDICDAIESKETHDDPEIRHAIDDARDYMIINAGDPCETVVPAFRAALDKIKVVSGPTLGGNLSASQGKWQQFPAVGIARDLVQYCQILNITVTLGVHVRCSV